MFELDLKAGQSGSAFDHFCLPDRLDARVRLAAMSTLASTLAHEVNQPLSVAANYINASASLLRTRGDCCEDVLEMIEQASHETQKAGEIVRRMRNFILSGRISGRREDIGDMIQRVVGSLALPDGSDVEIEYGVAPDARFVIAERIQIEQVLSNILENACEAVSGRDIRRITILAVSLGGEILVQIRDSGPGLSDHALEHLFEPLFTTKESGTGLGMPICKAIVDAHGGNLWAERPAQGGATLCMTLPAAD